MLSTQKPSCIRRCWIAATLALFCPWRAGDSGTASGGTGIGPGGAVVGGVVGGATVVGATEVEAAGVDVAAPPPVGPVLASRRTTALLAAPAQPARSTTSPATAAVSCARVTTPG